MKKIFYLIVLLAFIIACSSEPHYTIKGVIANADSITFLLQKRVSDKIVTIDSAYSKKGTFKMKGRIEYPDMVQLIAKNTSYGTSFFIENSEMTITGKLDSLFDAKVTGSKTQDEYRSLIDGIKPLSDQYSKLYSDYQEARRSNDTAKISQIRKGASAISKQMLTLQKDFIKNNPSSYVTPLLLRDLSLEMETGELETAVNALDTNIAKLPDMQDIMVRVKAMKAVDIGQKAPDFTLNDVNGKPVSLYSKVGSRLLLIDFWAAWCNPCRLENPNVVKIYNEYHKKGFDIFGVSLDQSKEDWVKAIEADKLTWTEVSDLQYWNSAAAKIYAVNAIPANFLLDDKGTIIARNLRGEALRNKVSEILGSK